MVAGSLHKSGTHILVWTRLVRVIWEPNKSWVFLLGLSYSEPGVS